MTILYVLALGLAALALGYAIGRRHARERYQQAVHGIRMAHQEMVATLAAGRRP